LWWLSFLAVDIGWYCLESGQQRTAEWWKTAIFSILGRFILGNYFTGKEKIIVI